MLDSPSIVSDLLDEIINLAANGSKPLPDVLRQCLILAHELKNERLKNWANQELNGYESHENLPEYRVLPTHLLGDFVGPFGSGAKNMPLGAHLLKEEHRHWAEKMFMVQPIEALQKVVSSAKSSTIRFPWPGELVAFYQDTIRTENQMVLVSAEQLASTTAVAGILDIVRNKTLNMALEIKSEVGTSYKDLHVASTEKEQKIQNIVIHNIGGIANIADGHSHIDASGQVQNTITVGDRESLDRALLDAGLDKTDLASLTEAMKDDDDKPGSRVMQWAKEKGSKVLSAGVKVGQKVGTALLIAWLDAHYGIKP